MGSLIQLCACDDAFFYKQLNQCRLLNWIEITYRILCPYTRGYRLNECFVVHTVNSGLSNGLVAKESLIDTFTTSGH